MQRQILVISTLAACLALVGCAHPHVPDFMVEGRLPGFPGRNTPEPAPAVASAPPRPAPAEQPRPAPPPPAPPAPAPVAAAIPAPLPSPSVPLPPVPPEPVPPEPVPPEPEPVTAPVAPAAPAVKAKAPKPPRAAKSPPAEAIAGGFGEVTDKRLIKAISDFAMSAAPNGYLLKSVKSVQSQVVAGTNYQLCLRVRTPGHEASWIRQRLVKAVVWQHLDQSMELTDWNEVETCP